MTKAHKKAILGYRKGIFELHAETKKEDFLKKIKFLKRMIRNCENR